MKRAPLFILSLILLSGCKVPFFKVVSNSFVKEMCSCLFVVGQDENYCKAYARQILPVSSYTIDQQTKKVLADGLGHSGSASYISNELGCRLEDIEFPKR